MMMPLRWLSATLIALFCSTMFQKEHNRMVRDPQVGCRLRRGLSVETTTTSWSWSSPPETIEEKSDSSVGIENNSSGNNRRKLVAYHQSYWEKSWFEHAEEANAKREVCLRMVHGKHNSMSTHRFLNLLCSTRAPEPHQHWCYFHDYNAHFMWYNSQSVETFQVYIDEVPPELQGVTPPDKLNPVTSSPEWDEIMSKFVFLDEVTGVEYVEYIEPLVGHLRFPLAGCLENSTTLFDFPSYVIPPPDLSRVQGRKFLYDIGSKDWSRMRYIVEEWQAHGVDFDKIISFSQYGQEEDRFMKTVPLSRWENLLRKSVLLVDQPSSSGKVFLPNKLQVHGESDYVLVKYDRASGALLQRLVVYLLEHPEIHVDELMYEINAAGNYALQGWFDRNLKPDGLADMRLRDGYQMLLELRFRGVRAHSWI